MQNEVIRILSDLGEMDHPQRVRYYLVHKCFNHRNLCCIIRQEMAAHLLKCFIDYIRRLICSSNADVKCIGENGQSYLEANVSLSFP